MPTIHFLPFQKSIKTDGRRTLLELARELGLPLQAVCGGKKICGRCRVIIEEAREPLPAPMERERETLGDLVEKGYRLACETVLTGKARVRIPEESQTRPPPILTSSGFGEVPVRLQPAVEPYFLTVPPPVLEKVTADRERLLEALEAAYGLKKIAVDPRILAQLPQTLRARRHQVTVVVRNGREVVGLFPGREERLIGLAVDIGTTTLVVYLLDLQSGDRLAVSSALNPQVHFGDDIISRLAFCQRDPEGAIQLREAVRAGINDLIGRAVEKAGVRPELIQEAAVAGNTAMHHLFLGLETQFLARAPYPPAVQGGVFVKGREVGLAINPSATVQMLPLKAGFVGSDTIADILATGLHKSSRVRLLIDLGTNGEIVLGNKDRLLCCSTAAGPAFEGGHILWGMRASPGAVEKVRMDPETMEISLDTIDDQPPQGLCGSGILSLVAEMIRGGVLLAKGNFNPALRS
ncbi:MAG TPA: ASKHA domain-containing protein, partial [Thermodesulfobacteriota bacterium]|nr:ASKHA domain-containing protein [Thermodesulfobacteriota bacterium]